MSFTTTLFLRVFDALADKEIDWLADDVRVMLLSSSYTPNLDSHDYVDDVRAYEISGTNYTADGALLAGKTVNVNTTDNRVEFGANDVSWASATITARYAVVYVDTGVDSTSPLIALLDFGGAESVTAGTFPINWGDGGVFYLAQG